jgi:hypothetical protein
VSYTEYTMLRALANRTFKGALMAIDNCSRLGNECDLLVVTKSLQCIDVEVKISRADLKQDSAKDKWFESFDYRRHNYAEYRKTRASVHWPTRVWKHYYAIAANIWCDDLLQYCQPKSGVVVVELGSSGYIRSVTHKRKAVANPDQQPASIHLLRDLARLTSYRLWDARAELDAARAQLCEQRGAA